MGGANGSQPPVFKVCRKLVGTQNTLYTLKDGFEVCFFFFSIVEPGEQGSLLQPVALVMGPSRIIFWHALFVCGETMQ